MKKSLIVFALILTTIPLGIVGYIYSAKYQHTCTDQTHLSCDGNCTCDGLECGQYIIHPKHCMCEFCIEATDSGSRDYIIKESKDSIFTYNNENQLTDVYSIHNNNSTDFDYHLRIHYDTAWLYDNTGALVSTGNFDSIPELIIRDNQ